MALAFLSLIAVAIFLVFWWNGKTLFGRQILREDVQAVAVVASLFIASLTLLRQERAQELSHYPYLHYDLPSEDHMLSSYAYLHNVGKGLATDVRPKIVLHTFCRHSLLDNAIFYFKIWLVNKFPFITASCQTLPNIPYIQPDTRIEVDVAPSIQTLTPGTRFRLGIITDADSLTGSSINFVQITKVLKLIPQTEY